MNTQSDANDLIRWLEVPQHANVFALGNFARQVTFASQQSRAFNLIWALVETNRLTTGSSVAIIGAGVGGLSAVAAALVNGCKVDLYEQASQPCPLQRGNDIRFIHPNILRWPDEDSDRNETNFPFLNWTATNVRGVIKQIDLQWKHIAKNPNLRLFFNYRVNRLYVSSNKFGLQRPWISANRIVDGTALSYNRLPRESIPHLMRMPASVPTQGFLELAYDCIILAVGFGDERALNGVPFLSYWENESLHQETGRERRSILVSGCGDGGLIDALRLRLRNFDHAEFVGRILSGVESRSVIQSLQNAERDLRKYAIAPDISLRFQASYDAITVSPQIERYFLGERRNDTTVTLNSPAAGPLSFQSSLLNRYATYLAMRYADLHYLSGRVLADRAEDGRFKVTLQRSDVDLRETKVFDLVIVRHGPESAIRLLLPDAIIRELQMWWEKNDDITVRPRWSPGSVYSVTAQVDAQELALTTFNSAYRVLTQGGKDLQVQSVAVGEHDGKTGFIVTLKPGSVLPQPKLYAGVLVQYVISAQTPSSAVPPAGVQAGEQSVQVGVGIYNYDASRRLAQVLTPTTNETLPPDGASPAGQGDDLTDIPPVEMGTLGCYATDKQGGTYLLSAANVLSPSRVGLPDDRIFLESQSPATHMPIARLTSVLPGEQIGFAKLEPRVRPSYDLFINQWRVLRIGSADPGDRVAKVGRTSGFTTGLVTATHVTISVAMSNAETVLLSDCAQIGPDQSSQDFHLPGDGGAVVVREDGTAIGILIAGAPSTAFVYPLESDMKKWKLTLMASVLAKPH
jgi:hypothetical protein